MPWWFDVIERKHELQNPTSADKILLLGERLGLNADSHVLDMGAGKLGPAVLLAGTFGCRFTCVEKSPEFVVAARRKVHAVGLDPLVEIIESDGASFEIEKERYDVAMCLGAGFIWGGLEGTLHALDPAVTTGGFVVVGEPYWRRWPVPKDFEPDDDYVFAGLPETVRRFDQEGLEIVGLIASSQDDWDRYESLHWQALEEWLHDNPNDPEADGFRELGRRERDLYLRWHRDLLGWAIFIGRKR